MFEKEEQELLKLNDKLQAAASPDDMELYIRNGIKLGIKRKQKNKIKFLANAAAILILAAFLTSIRISPVFAAYIEKLPGLEYIVKVINYDKGINSIVENNFVQHINASVEKEGIRVTIKDMIIDNSKAIIFYEIKNKSNYKNIQLTSINIKDEKGKNLKEVSVNWGSYIEDMSLKKKADNCIQLDFNDKTIIPDKFILELKIGVSDSPEDRKKILESVWNYEFPTNKSNFKDMEKTYTLNQSVEVQGQKILFKTAKVTPTRIAVDVGYDKNNTKKILRFDDISIINEKGEKWATITNGVSGTRADDNHEILYFESNYFSSSKELYITGTRIRAVDKTKSVIELNPENNELINVPDDKLKLETVTKENSEITFKFSLESDKKLDKNYVYSVFYCVYKDSAGKSINCESVSCDSGQNGIQIIEFRVPDNTKFPIYLTVEDYPSRIKGNFKIKIK